MIKADYVAEKPDIDVKNTGYRVNNVVVMTIGELEISLHEREAKELCEDLDGELNGETKAGIEDKLEKAEEKISELEDEISDLKAQIEQLEEVQ
jgi:uncharacterized protein YhaN